MGAKLYIDSKLGSPYYLYAANYAASITLYLPNNSGSAVYEAPAQYVKYNVSAGSIHSVFTGAGSHTIQIYNINTSSTSLWQNPGPYSASVFYGGDVYSINFSWLSKPLDSHYVANYFCPTPQRTEIRSVLVGTSSYSSRFRPYDIPNTVLSNYVSRLTDGTVSVYSANRTVSFFASSGGLYQFYLASNTDQRETIPVIVDFKAPALSAGDPVFVVRGDQRYSMLSEESSQIIDTSGYNAFKVDRLYPKYVSVNNAVEQRCGFGVIDYASNHTSVSSSNSAGSSMVDGVVTPMQPNLVYLPTDVFNKISNQRPVVCKSSGSGWTAAVMPYYVDASPYGNEFYIDSITAPTINVVYSRVIISSTAGISSSNLNLEEDSSAYMWNKRYQTSGGLYLSRTSPFVDSFFVYDVFYSDTFDLDRGPQHAPIIKYRPSAWYSADTYYSGQYERQGIFYQNVASCSEGLVITPILEQPIDYFYDSSYISWGAFGYYRSGSLTVKNTLSGFVHIIGRVIFRPHIHSWYISSEYISRSGADPVSYTTHYDTSYTGPVHTEFVYIDIPLSTTHINMMDSGFTYTSNSSGESGYMYHSYAFTTSGIRDGSYPGPPISSFRYSRVHTVPNTYTYICSGLNFQIYSNAYSSGVDGSDVPCMLDYYEKADSAVVPMFMYANYAVLDSAYRVYGMDLPTIAHYSSSSYNTRTTAFGPEYLVSDVWLNIRGISEYSPDYIKNSDYNTLGSIFSVYMDFDRMSNTFDSHKSGSVYWQRGYIDDAYFLNYAFLSVSVTTNSRSCGEQNNE